MSDAPYNLWCYVEGDNTHFRILASPTMIIDDIEIFDQSKEEQTFFKGSMLQASLFGRCVISSD